MEFPEKLFYTKDHEWLSSRKGACTVGVTAYAVDQLGDIVHVDLPSVGDVIKGGDSFGTIESTKTVSDLYLPASGKVVEINHAAANEPESIGKDPYGVGWLIKVELLEDAEGSTMVASAYDNYLKNTH